jgi:hypothetical protein
MSAPGAVTDKTAVLAQLERILGSPSFRNSKRYSRFLRYLVEQTLAGSAGVLKERMLGVDVFGRPAEYDNYSDPVVRMAAGEVRKRIAQYYHDPGRERELRIDLPLGSYVPEFIETVLPPEQSAPPAIPATPAAVLPARRPVRLLTGIACAAVMVAALALWHPWVRPGAFEKFWQPFLDRGSPVIICVARLRFGGTAPNQPTASLPAFLAWSDSSTATKVASLIASTAHSYQLKRDDDLTFEDLRRGPSILIGAFNDVWTLRLTENLRFEFQNEGTLRWIGDRNNPASRAWSTDFSSAARPRDFAVVSRLLSSRSGRPVLTIAGIGPSGTEIAGEFVANRAFLEALAAKSPAGWQNRNMQVVLETEVIEGHPGPPRIQAIHTW